jgi:hypothetical protein
MDTKLTVWNGSSSSWIFFARFAENSSSFFSGLNLFPGGFSSVAMCGFRVMVPVVFGTDEAAQSPPEVLALQGTFSSRLSYRTPSALLP